MPSHNGEGRPGQGGLQDQAKIHGHSTAVADTPDLALDRFLRAIEAPPRRRPQRELARDGFTPWLVAQCHRDDWVGHLPRDVTYDTSWPRGQVRLRELHDYFYDLYALDAVHAALDQAWAEWREAAI